MIGEGSSSPRPRRPRRQIVMALASVTFAAFLVLVYAGFWAPNSNPSYRDKANELVHLLKPKPKPAPQQASFGELHALFDAASNRTLGVDSIKFVNLPHRHDKFDAAAIQALVSNIDLEFYPAVLAADLQDAGLPPMENLNRLTKNEIGCWRAHANIWRDMVQRGTPAVLILEADAAWDVNIRQQMSVLNQAFRDLLREVNPRASVPTDPLDPWAATTGLWDVISIGHCSDTYPDKTPFRIFDDPHAPSSGYKWNREHELKSQRVVYKAGGMACTTGYMISLRGASKLLVRMAFNLNEPIDLIMNEMGKKGEMVHYNVMQQLVAQWVYVPGIGMDARGGNSDIAKPGDELGNNRGSGDSQDAPDGWPQAKKDMSVWGIKPMYKDTAFKEMALQVAWKKVNEVPRG